MSITSDEVNFIVYRYLQESGFQHSAFTFGSESLITKSNINGSQVPPGALVSFVQKGLQYMELEAHVREEQNEIVCDPPFTLLNAHVARPKVSKSVKAEASGDAGAEDEAQPMDEDKAEDDAEDRKHPVDEVEETRSIEVSPDDVTTLSGHQSEVFICAWSPAAQLLASGSGDSTARIWEILEHPRDGKNNSDRSLVLKHNSSDKEKSKDVTTLDWNHDGSYLATGSYDGQARIWTDQGKLLNSLNKHRGPIFSLKWNRTGEYLLSGSVDKTAIIWDAATGSVKQEFEFHKAPTLDVDWKNASSFATCSTDKMIYVCRLGETRFLKCFQGHQDEVNAIKWDPSGNLLASCSDDYSAKVWSMKHDKCRHDLNEHTKEIYTIKWSPAGTGADLPSSNLILASASFDSTIKLWNAEVGSCLNTLTKHSDPVYSVAFSPDGTLLASGSFDRCLHVWSVRDGSLVKTFKGEGGIFEVCWNKDGNKVAACFSNNTVSVIDVRI